jgi:hypothetical protein
MLLYADCQDWVEHNGISHPPEQNQFKYREHETGGTLSVFLAVTYEFGKMHNLYIFQPLFLFFRIRRFSRYASRFHHVFDGAHRVEKNDRGFFCIYSLKVFPTRDIFFK